MIKVVCTNEEKENMMNYGFNWEDVVFQEEDRTGKRMKNHPVIKMIRYFRRSKKNGVLNVGWEKDGRIAITVKPEYFLKAFDKKSQYMASINKNTVVLSKEDDWYIIKAYTKYEDYMNHINRIVEEEVKKND